MSYIKDEMYQFLEKCVELPEMGYYDYDWDRFASYYDPRTEMFYWVEGSGCSCNDLWDDINTIGDMNVGRKDEFLRAASSFAENSYSGYSDNLQEVREAVDKL